MNGLLWGLSIKHLVRHQLLGLIESLVAFSIHVAYGFLYVHFIIAAQCHRPAYNIINIIEFPSFVSLSLLPMVVADC